MWHSRIPHDIYYNGHLTPKVINMCDIFSYHSSADEDSIVLHWHVGTNFSEGSAACICRAFQ